MLMMEQTNSQCGVQPSAVFLLLTLLVTSSATAMLCAAIMTDHWEYIEWNRGKLEKIASGMKNTTPHGLYHYPLEWLLDGQVARVLLQPRKITRREHDNLPALFLVSVHGGIWTQCLTLTDEQRTVLHTMGFPSSQCTDYLAPELMRIEDGVRTDWQHRMQNLSISCSLVCLIILGSSALVGAFGVLKHQISAVLVTGVMYLLAATFAMFTLTILHFKRTQTPADCGTAASSFGLTIDGVVVSQIAQDRPYYLGKSTEYFYAREYKTGWSLHLGWSGVGMCILVSVMWILLSKIIRYYPLSSLLTVL